MGRITGMDYRNGLLYAVLSASNVFYMLRIAYSSPREKLVRPIPVNERNAVNCWFQYWEITRIYVHKHYAPTDVNHALKLL